jgi:hypothetical protein
LGIRWEVGAFLGRLGKGIKGAFAFVCCIYVCLACIESGLATVSRKIQVYTFQVGFRRDVS